MYLQKVIGRKTKVRGMDLRIQIRIRIHTKMSWISNTEINYCDTVKSISGRIRC
jgi:hypothetical protein